MVTFKMKGVLTLVVSIITFVSGNFTPLIILLIFFEIADYVTGIYASWRKKRLSSKSAIEGFFKKLFYFFLISVAFGFDYMIFEITKYLSIEFEYPAIFGVLSVCYLLSTEMISITENLSKIGISIPFFTTALKAFKGRIEEVGNAKNKEKPKEEIKEEKKEKEEIGETDGDRKA